MQEYYTQPGTKIKFLLKDKNNSEMSFHYIKEFYPGNHWTRIAEGHFAENCYTGIEDSFFSFPIMSDPDEVWFVNKIFDSLVL
jgi:hypothetical protein